MDSKNKYDGSDSSSIRQYLIKHSILHEIFIDDFTSLQAAELLKFLDKKTHLNMYSVE